MTGSSGKTTVKELIGNLLKNFGETYFSPNSFNNSFGVPLSLCNLENFHKYGVFEIGMSKKGEIRKIQYTFSDKHTILQKKIFTSVLFQDLWSEI